MSTQDPVQELKKEIDAIQSSVNSLHSKVRLSDVRDSVEDLQTRISNLPAKVKDLRARGYPFEKGLESKATDFAAQWPPVQARVLTEIDRQALALERALAPLEEDFRRLVAQASMPSVAQPLLTQAQSAVSTLESKVSAASSSIYGMYDDLQVQVQEVFNQLQQVEWALKQVAEATFRLFPTEAAIMAVKATWAKGEKEDKDDPQGILYLTDQRLLFEQKQEVATKKLLFITTQKEKVQQLLLEVPVALVNNVKATKRGFLGHEDHIELTFSPDAAVEAAHFHIDGQDCNQWQGLIGRAKARDFDADRAVAVDEAAVEKVRSAPTACPQCGAAITTQILRGMDSVRCEYCGKVIRL
jgi:hypothetical protein